MVYTWALCALVISWGADAITVPPALPTEPSAKRGQWGHWVSRWVSFYPYRGPRILP